MSLRRASRPRLARIAALALLGSLAPAGAAADSFTPVRIGVGATPIARLGVRLPVRISLSADAGALDASAPLRLRVKLAPECGGAFAYTPGVVLLDRLLSPQPATGRAYAATISGGGSPRSYGMQTVCVFVEQQGDARELATDQSVEVDVSRTCTVAARRYDGARRAVARARRRHRGVAAARRRAARSRRIAVRRCGPGVRL